MRTQIAAAPDVAIVGAGPAGSVAAYVLERAGARVVILDPSHPREKPCGGGLTARALAEIPHVVDQLATNAAIADRARFSSGFERDVTVGLNDAGLSPNSTLAIVSRRVLDAVLLKAATDVGALHLAERASDVREHGGITVVTPQRHLRPGFVIGADGANSLVRRRLAIPFRRDQLSIATGYFAHGVTSREIAISFVAEPPGYLWSFPRPDHLAIGICAEAHQTRPEPLRRLAREWMDRQRLAPGAELEQYGWPIPSLVGRDFDRERPAGSDWALVGDAAGLVDPITREGIHYALWSGRRLAELIIESRPNAAARYQRWLQDEVYPELRRAARLKAGFFRPSFLQLVLDGLARSASIRSVMVDLIAGRQSYRTLPRRLLATFEVGLAWRLFFVTAQSAYRPFCG